VVGACGGNEGEDESLYSLLVGKPEGKRPLRKRKRRWAYDIKMNIVEIGWCGGDSIGLAQGKDSWRVCVNAVMKLRVL
jgi:hypothetical protein